MEFLGVLGHVSGDDHGFHKRVSSIHKDVWDVFEILISGGKMDNFTVSEDHFVFSQLSSGHVMSVNLTQIETFLGLKICLKLDLLLSDLPIFLFLINGSDIESTVDRWEASSFLSCDGGSRLACGLGEFTVFGIYSFSKSFHDLAVGSLQLR
jgi:hypothetical protein